MSGGVYKFDEIKSRLTPVFDANWVRSAVLFGSYAKNSATEKSDVDLLVDSGLKGLKFFGLVEYIRDALDKEVDVIDVSHVVQNSPVDNEIKKTGIIIYG